MNKSPVVSISNISKSYMQNSGTSLPVLQNISFKIMNNEIVAIIGHSGCGKTTLLRIICSFEPMDEGVVLLDGIRCIKPCSDILMLFQEFNQLMPWKTVLGNIIHPLLATKFVKSTKDAKELALGRIEDVGLIGFENSYPHQLSSGMKQRAVVARALALQPRVLLMDEPFASLDNITRNTLQDLTRSVCEKYGISALLVTHNIEEAITMANKIIIMDKSPGRIKTIIENNVSDVLSKHRRDFAAEILELIGGTAVNNCD